MGPRNILVCPLDWGLGHASRCVPMIKLLVEEGCNVMIAADKRPLAFLRKEFPKLEFIQLPGYKFSYSSGKRMNLRMAFYTPVILAGIYGEHRRLKKIISERKINVVISDNRFGLWNKNIQSIYICHHLWVKLPGILRSLEPVLYSLHRFFIRHYNQCWIPDYENEPNLSGELSHFSKLPQNTTFIGPLSRFSYRDIKTGNPSAYDVAVILSGPEPQRSILELKLILQIKELRLKAVIFRGVTEELKRTKMGPEIFFFTHLPTDDMLREISSASLVICRSGYTGIMDLACLGKKAMFIPTPGQTEQEYLASHYLEKGVYYYKKQNEVNLKIDIPEALKYPGIKFEYNYDLLLGKIREVIALIS